MTNKPQHVSDDCWYYEEPDGIAVTLWAKTAPTGRVGGLATIPWVMLRRSLARRDKQKTPKSKP